MLKWNLSFKLHLITFQKAMILVFSMFKDKYIPEEDLTLFE
jgi:hypothetical protein